MGFPFKRDENRKRNMKVGIIGASAAGLYVALLIKDRNPDAIVEVFDRAEKAGKKLLATGNGHCNLMHVPFTSRCFNNPSFVEALLQKHPETKLLKTLADLGIETLAKDGLLYPLSYSASAHVNFLISTAMRKGVTFHLGQTVKDVVDTSIVTEQGSKTFDHVVFAFGGMSQKNLGSDGSMFDVLKRRGYRISALRPSLCPIETPDVGKALFGVRHSAKVTLMRQGKAVYQEVGEVQFKKDAVSGIAVMNASSFFSPGDTLVLNLMYPFSEREIQARLSDSYRRFGPDFLKPYLESALAQFTMKKCGISQEKGLIDKDFSRIAKFLICFELRLTKLFDFDSSQVTRGGIELDQIAPDLSSKINPKHHFAGECLDVDGLCGGYNLGFALLSALEVAESL